MKRRGNANTWLLGILITILGAIGIDVWHRMSVPQKPKNREEAKVQSTPPFKRGEPAPDFSLPLGTHEIKSLSQVVQGDTVLTFTCGCSNCREMHTYLATLLAKMGPRAPKVVTVTSMPPEAETSWIRDTKLQQTIFYQPAPGGPYYNEMKKAMEPHHVTNVIDFYKGHPCPRIYRLNARREVVWIGPSFAELPPVIGEAEMAGQVAQALGFSPPGSQPYPGKPVAPDFHLPGAPKNLKLTAGISRS